MFFRLSVFVVLAVWSAPFASARQLNEAVPQPGTEAAQTDTAETAEPSSQAGETIVTARKYEERLIDVPVSVSVIRGDELERAGHRTVRDAALLFPNLSLTEFSSRRLSFPYFRGVGSGIGEPAVVTYIDGVPQLATGSTNIPLIGLDRVEFLRGPQGTLYGRNALGGVIQLISERPAAAPTWGLGATVGDHGFHEYELSYSGPVSDNGVSANVSTLYSARDGYTTNNLTNRTVDDRDSFFARAQVYLNPTDDSELRIGLYGERARDGGFVLSNLEDSPLGQGLRSRPHRLQQDFEGVTERDIVSPSVAYERFGDTVNFTSITSYSDWDILETSDFDFSPIDGVRRRTAEAQEYFYQELRFATPEGREIQVGDDSELRWLVGLSGFVADSSRSAANDFRPGGAGILFDPTQVGVDTTSGDFDDLAGGLFGQVTWITHEDLELTAGLRYDVESKEADLRRTFVSGGIPFVDVSQSVEEDYDELVPQFSAAYHVDEDTTIYGSVAKGFKAGGFNLAAPAGQTEFGQETSWTYEVGVKRAWNEGKVLARGSIFYIDWEDMQLSLFDPMAGGFIDNAGQSTSQGGEVELAAEVSDGWQVFATAGITDTEFDEFIDSFGQDTAGNALAFAPEETWSFGTEYTHELADDSQWYVRGEYIGVGTFYYDPGNVGSESYELVNVRAGYRRGNWSADIWVRNAFDEEYVPIAFQPNPADPTQFIGENGAPQTLGVTLRTSF